MANPLKTVREQIAGVRPFAPPRNKAAITAARALRDLATGRTPTDSTPESVTKPPVSEQPYGLVPGPPLPRVEPIPHDAPWDEPPVGDKQGIARSIYETGDKPPAYDTELLERLNEEYRDKPIVPSPPSWEPTAKAAAARRRVEWAHNLVDLRDKTVLEIGCGGGHETWSMAHNLGCDAHGVDVLQANAWEDLADSRVHFTMADLAVENPFEESTFDRIVSYTVWEHVVHPHKLLEETFRIMKPGGLQWLRANLWAGPQASHRYRDIFFPWPHLLFSDDVIREWDAMHGRTTQGAAWVNHLSWNHYERYIHDVGFRLRHLHFQDAELNWEFYDRFEDRLGRWPITDLRRDFFLAVLEKPA